MQAFYNELPHRQNIRVVNERNRNVHAKYSYPQAYMDKTCTENY